MREERLSDEDAAVWEFVDALTAGREVDWDAAASGTARAHRSLVRELASVARLLAVHEELHRAEGDAAVRTGEEVWGPLVIEEKIGEGAFGDVYRAREPRLDRQVAVKFYRPHRLSPSQLGSEVIEEGRLLARVRHPNVVTVHGAEQIDGRFGVWMEFVEGSTLEDIVVERGAFGAADAAEIGRDLCRALRALHAAGVLHRDIKARNVMREESGRVVLMDLGISCEIDRQVPVRQYGTPLYAAPEVLLANQSSPQGDIYSLGVLLFFLVSGRYPVEGATLADIQAVHQTGAHASLDGLRPDLPRIFVRVVDRALAGDRDHRFASAAELETALDEALRDMNDRGERFAASDRRVGATTGNQEAYNRYLQGLRLWSRRYRGGLPKALEFFRQAAALDPRFGLAHVGVANCLNQLSHYQFIRPRDGFPEARAAAERALALDPELGEAHSALGYISFFFDWDYEEAARQLKLAMRLCPRFAPARQWYALLLSAQGRHDEALAAVRKGREMDPASLLVAAEATVLTTAGRSEEAIATYRLTLETDPDSAIHHVHLGGSLWSIGEFAESERCLREAIRLSKGEDTYPIGMLGAILAFAGRIDEALEAVAQLDALAERRYVSNFHRLMPWFVLDRYDKWGPLLERAIAEHDTFLVWIRSSHAYTGLRADPRAVGPLRRVGLLD